MDTTLNNSRLTVVKLVGAVNHPTFLNAVTLLRATALCASDSHASPEIIVVAQARPGQISPREIESLQRQWPLAGMVAILDSWCEGEIRTGRPWPGVKRFYWYEFPAWWQQQLALQCAGHCPEWARPTTDPYRIPAIREEFTRRGGKSEIRNSLHGLIRLSTADRDTADTLADTLHDAGYATVWNPPSRKKMTVRGAVAGIWDGGQLDDRESMDLAAYCRALASDAAPVVAVLDFPRRDRCELARQLGAAAVLGKPWINADLIATIDNIVRRDAWIAATHPRAA